MTRRTLVLLVAAGATLALLVLVVFPTRSYLGERSNLSSVSHQLRSLNSQNRQLTDQINRLNSDSEIERLARKDYGLIKPGEEAYALLPGSLAKNGPPTPTARPAPATQGAGSRPPGHQPHQTAASPAQPGFWDRFLDQLAFWR